MEVLNEIWPHLTGGLTLLATLLGSAHVVLNKRDVRAALGWVGMMWLVPVLGVVLYLLLGVNRIKRRGAALSRPQLEGSTETGPFLLPAPEEDTRGVRRAIPPQLRELERLIDSITRRRIVTGNEIVPLVNGEAAYPRMLDAIASAERSVALCSYIFDNDETGKTFARALGDAHRRGVEVRVLVDAAGARYTFPTIHWEMRRESVPYARFLPTLLPWRMPYMNLRSHRKIMVVDGTLGFTGGMNIRAGHRLDRPHDHHVKDVHFELRGPVVAHLMETFAEDWLFARGEHLEGERWFPRLEAAGELLARGIRDGPDHDFEKLRWTLLGALGCAEKRVRITTPYFLPDSSLTTALNVAAMRGVHVDLVLPEKNNLALVQWASTGMLWQVLEHGVNVWLSPPPFDHSKLMVVDSAWTLLGSTNWDPRSLRLNFEFNVECYGDRLASRVENLIEAKIGTARRVTLDDVLARPLPVRLRDGAARLLQPYL